MNKRDLIKWLEIKREEAIQNADEQYQHAYRKHKERLYMTLELEKTAENIECHIKNAYEVYAKWREKHKDDTKISSYYRGSIGRFLEETLNGKVYERMKGYDIDDDTDENKLLSTKRRNTVNEINRNYDNLIINVKSLKTAKLACDYLKGIGFDVSNMELKEDACTALSTPIDTKYLFVQGISEKAV